jgi:hypothetical protein
MCYRSFAARCFQPSSWALLFFFVATTFLSTAWAQKPEGILYSFQGGTDGSSPVGHMVFDASGDLYGTTTNGGSSSCRSDFQCGTVYQLAPPAQPGGIWTETVLYVFQGNTSGDGSSPLGGLTIDNAGNLYGTTATGGAGNCVVLGILMGCGTVFELSPPKMKGEAWTEEVLYSFQSGDDGYLPYGDLVFDSAGNLYGVTLYGGGYGTNCGDAYYLYCGTVFELSPPNIQGGAWTEQVLYGFKGVERGALIGDGANPNGGLAFDGAGEIYGTTQIGGFNCPHRSGAGGCGTAFKLTPPAKKGQPWTETIIHRFISVLDGESPGGGLTSAGNGGFYGTTQFGGLGQNQYGTVFLLAPGPDGSWTKYVLYSFEGLSDGSKPTGSILLDAEGDLYGTSLSGGVGGGTLYELPRTSIASRTLDILHEFRGNPDGAQPLGGLVFDAAGNLYGNTSEGGTGSACGSYGCGTIFQLNPLGTREPIQTFGYGRK